MQCPHCQLINPDTAERCDCGHDFRSGEVRRPYPTAQPRRAGEWDQALVLISALLILLALLGSAPLLYRIMTAIGC